MGINLEKANVWMYRAFCAVGILNLMALVYYVVQLIAIENGGK